MFLRRRWKRGRTEYETGTAWNRPPTIAAVERVGAAVGSDDDAARLVDEVVASRIQAIANKRHVAMLAVEHLASPSLDTEAGPESDAEEVDLDWLNYFGGYAEKASSKKVRDLWARVLAGEIRHPGSFSRADAAALGGTGPTDGIVVSAGDRISDLREVHSSTPSTGAKGGWTG